MPGVIRVTKFLRRLLSVLPVTIRVSSDIVPLLRLLSLGIPSLVLLLSHVNFKSLMHPAVPRLINPSASVANVSFS